MARLAPETDPLAAEIPPAVVARLDLYGSEPVHPHQVWTRINSAALAAGALKP